MTRNPDLLLTLALLGSVLALGIAAFLASRPPRPKRRMSNAELRHRFPMVHNRMRGRVRW